MKISVITPTADRQHYLRGIYFLLQQQTYQNWEWLIYDTSLRSMHFEDPRVVYIHDEAIVTIGEKRNRLIAKATGEYIVHCDDDDYYAPCYLANSIARLKNASFFTLNSWFSYDTKTCQIFYWDTLQESKIRYCLDPLSGSRIREIEFGDSLSDMTFNLNKKGQIGYGFSFVYTRDLGLKCPFPDIDFGEDHHFFQKIQANGSQCANASDEKGEVIHVIHDSNTSIEFPQYRIPHFLVKPLFPPFFSYLKLVHEN